MFYPSHYVATMGFKSVGKNVKISDKAAFYEPEKMEIGDNSRIDDFCVVSGKITIGRNVHIAPQVLLAGGEPGITFNDFSAIAYQGIVITQSDDYLGYAMSNPTIPEKYRLVDKRPVTIGAHVLIGSRVTIFPGASIGEGSSVGAHSLVLNPLQPWGVYAGTPAAFLKKRRKGLLDKCEQYLKKEGK